MNLSKNLSGRILLLAIFIGFALSLVLLFYFSLRIRIHSDPASFIENAALPLKQEHINYGLPVRLKIPNINVDATIDPVGIMPNGTMEVPSEPRNVGWFSFGPHPGDNGSAVIDGHYGRWKNGEGSVFDDLSKLKEGDSLYIEDEKGMMTTFVVRESRSYDPNADASDVFSSDDGKSHLNLITCEGVWNKDSKSYSKRLVVFTDKEEE